jgi:pimeloyl-ACP methyl ester carboxylesterase
MGGELAIRLAAERPELVRSLVLVNAAGVPFALHPSPHLRALPKAPVSGASIARVLIPDFLRAGPTSVAVASMRVLRGDARAWMEKVRAPALLVWGAGDPLVPLSYGEEMHRLIPNSRLVVVSHAAHVAMWDNPDEFNALVLDFLDEVERQHSPAATRGAFVWGISGWTNGIAHREAGKRRDIVLVHGLGMSSAYYVRFAQALYERGWNPVAPDLPGFGESVNAPGGRPEMHATWLADWADALNIRGAVWVGHSLSCNAVAHLAKGRPDIVRKSVMIGPVWTRHPLPLMRMGLMLMLDALREPLKLWSYILPAYWRTGVARWWMTVWRYTSDITDGEVVGDRLIAGERDPIPDRETVAVTSAPGAHACHFSHPDEVAELISRDVAPALKPAIPAE